MCYYDIGIYRQDYEIVLGAHNLTDLENGGGQPEIYAIQQLVFVSI